MLVGSMNFWIVWKLLIQTKENWTFSLSKHVSAANLIEISAQIKKRKGDTACQTWKLRKNSTFPHASSKIYSCWCIYICKFPSNNNISRPQWRLMQRVPAKSKHAEMAHFQWCAPVPHVPARPSSSHLKKHSFAFKRALFRHWQLWKCVRETGIIASSYSLHGTRDLSSPPYSWSSFDVVCFVLAAAHWCTPLWPSVVNDGDKAYCDAKTRAQVSHRVQVWCKRSVTDASCDLQKTLRGTAKHLGCHTFPVWCRSRRCNVRPNERTGCHEARAKNLQRDVACIKIFRQLGRATS